MLKLVFSIAILVLTVILAFKVTKKLIKIVLAFLFVGFVIYLFTGTDIISDFLRLLGIAG